MKLIRRASLATPERASARSRSRVRERGQVVVLFAGAMIALVALCAVVVDVAWYWTNNLRMQRAADAAALAGVVWLPSKPLTAYSVARAEAAKNGYTDGAGGVTITPVVDASNKQRLKVTITGPVGTFFARAVGINSFAAKRDSKADYVLPVPMGSPQNYYGVGFFEGLVPHTTTTTTTTNGNTGLDTAGAAPSGGQWTSSSGTIQAAVSGDDSAYAYSATNGQVQQWSTFGLTSGAGGVPNPGGNQALTVQGLEVNLTDAYLSAACASSKIAVEVSWNAGANGSWSTLQATPVLGTSTTAGDYAFGANNSTASWGGRAWTYDDFTDALFRVRLTAQKGCATAGRQLRVDMLQVRVTWKLDTTTTTTTWNKETLSVPDPIAPSSTLDSQGFWGAIFTSGGVRQNGDKYAPSYIGGGVTGVSSSSASPTYDSAGYDYTIELPGTAGLPSSGQVQLFDPIYCATGDNGHGGSFGAGDHWTTHGSTGTTDVAPVSVTYRLYNTQGTLLDVTDDGPPVATLTYDPGSSKLADLSGYFGTVSGSGLTDCSTNPAHNQWVSMAAGLNAGTYRLNVNTSLAPANLNVGAENLFSIWVKSSGDARVYGGGRMAAYTNLDTGQQKFYFAQIEKTHAGKTMEIKLFDPGETNGNAYLRLLSPDGNSYHYQSFDWESDDGRSGTDVTEIQTSNGSPLFDNKEITITVPLPTTYGQGGLNPPGDITDEDGWWLIEYQLSNGNDTTTWSVNIRGNPVHLVIP